LHKVLIVDDEVRVVRFVRLALGRSGYRVITATSGDKALRLARSFKPDAVILDIKPGTDGFEMLSKLRSILDMPIIAVSTRTGIADKAIGLGATVYLAKPFKPEELVQRIDALLAPESGP